MKPLHTTGIVTPEHRLVIDVPADLAAGPHRVVVVVDEGPTAEPAPGSWDDLVLPGSRWPAGGLSLRREDIYGDGER